MSAIGRSSRQRVLPPHFNGPPGAHFPLGRPGKRSAFSLPTNPATQIGN